jgi:glycosyltransferase involved in cell wall biosynthesis
MRIAQVAPLFESVPPSFYGGTERIVSYLTEELVRLGHEVVLFASGDSKTSAELVPVCDRALRLFPNCGDPLLYHFLLMEKVIAMQERFDIIHSHIEAIGFILGRRSRLPLLSTLHGRLDLPTHKMMFREYSEFPLIAISNAQKSYLPDAHWQGTIYHGIPQELYRMNERGGEYLVFVGRVSPEKNIEAAIRIAA